ncbi:MULTISPECIES: NADH-quinone oxidoreductase subunit NuoE [unclassified Pseudofrankia]|uniref:NADH-quinone oxidoreductase subunit NuoE n=1 Tax=unclassified Pseudofrankia TaxID=2994372 RepID=UPI0008D9C13F|nr:MULTISPECIES: NADH-quinone oxidoreductase subunit NuoE [unclassified Pseudofrankia]MDT3438596.1 NADH-quinone oxidoreductase subunit NuoE [Pseudofrankia sp. BMG5.37]OHV49345.1 NADH-quinone oxidoreductase subunit E [Pseudofrankia sp. BMG5.36]
MPLTDETRAAAREIIARYPVGRERSALLPMLHLVQAAEGCVTAEGVDLCAREIGITAAEVSAVATFYTMYKRRPVGDWLVSVCTNLSCALMGGQEVYDRISKKLGVGHDQTTPDGSITLEHAECLAACDYAPVMTVNYEFYDGVDEGAAEGLVEALQRGERPLPTRGGPLCTFAEVSRQLAGFEDPRPEGIAGPGFLEPSVAGLTLAEQAGWRGEVAGSSAAGPAGAVPVEDVPVEDVPPDRVPADGARSGATPAAGAPTTTPAAPAATKSKGA